MNSCLKYYICLLLLKVSSCLRPQQDYAMSVAGLQPLLELEREFIDELENYAQELQLKIDTIESFISEVSAKQAEAQKNREDFVSHPLNSYSLIRRLHEDWSYFEAYMSQPVGTEQLENIVKLVKEQAPQLSDVNDAMAAILRLQVFYNYHAINLTKGLMDDRQYSSQLTLLETFRMAQYCFYTDQNQYALEWYKVSVDLFDNNKDELIEQVYNLTLPKVYGAYINFLTSRGYAPDALEILNKVPDSDVGFWHYRRSIEDTTIYLKDRPQFISIPQNSIQIGCSKMYTTSKRLTCHYQRNFSHFLTLAPLKVETLSLQPYVVLFHAVIYDREIQDLLSVNLTSLKHHRSESFENSMKFTAVRKDVHDVLNYRVKDMTGLQIGRDKNFMLINFGLAGYISKSTPNKRSVDIIFFLSDVSKGGATVFDELKITVPPIKGSALLWHNGVNQPYFGHTSCPVVLGNKWALVKQLVDGVDMLP